jgi:hypothetical protein
MDSSAERGENRIPGSPPLHFSLDSAISTGQSSRQYLDGQSHSSGKEGRNNSPDPPPLTVPMDLAEKIKGMYRLLDLISESGSNGCGMSVLRICCEDPQFNFLSSQLTRSSSRRILSNTSSTRYALNHTHPSLKSILRPWTFSRSNLLAYMGLRLRLYAS